MRAKKKRSSAVKDEINAITSIAALGRVCYSVDVHIINEHIKKRTNKQAHSFS